MKRWMLLFTLFAILPAFLGCPNLNPVHAVRPGAKPVAPMIKGPLTPDDFVPHPVHNPVRYAPDVEEEVFRHGGLYYLKEGDEWYRSEVLDGPWDPVPGVPGVVIKASLE